MRKKPGSFSFIFSANNSLTYSMNEKIVTFLLKTTFKKVININR